MLAQLTLFNVSYVVKKYDMYVRECRDIKKCMVAHYCQLGLEYQVCLVQSFHAYTLSHEHATGIREDVCSCTLKEMPLLYRLKLHNETSAIIMYKQCQYDNYEATIFLYMAQELDVGRTIISVPKGSAIFYIEVRCSTKQAEKE